MRMPKGVFGTIVLCILSAALPAFVYVRYRSGFPLSLDPEEVERITVTMQGLPIERLDPIPGFVVPKEHHSTVLWALFPAREVHHFPSMEDIIGSILIETNGGKAITIRLCAGYQNPLYFWADDKKCVRVGEYKPVDKAGDFDIYTDESLHFYNILGILQEVSTGQATDSMKRRLASQLDYLRLSRGESSTKGEGWIAK